MLLHSSCRPDHGACNEIATENPWLPLNSINTRLILGIRRDLSLMPAWCPLWSMLLHYIRSRTTEGNLIFMKRFSSQFSIVVRMTENIDSQA